MATAPKRMTPKRPKRPRRFSPLKKPRKSQEGSNPPPRAPAKKKVGRKALSCDVCRKMKAKCLLNRGDMYVDNAWLTDVCLFGWVDGDFLGELGCLSFQEVIDYMIYLNTETATNLKLKIILSSTHAPKQLRAEWHKCHKGGGRGAGAGGGGRGAGAGGSERRLDAVGGGTVGEVVGGGTRVLG